VLHALHGANDPNHPMVEKKKLNGANAGKRQPKSLADRHGTQRIAHPTLHVMDGGQKTGQSIEGAGRLRHRKNQYTSRENTNLTPTRTLSDCGSATKCMQSAINRKIIVLQVQGYPFQNPKGLPCISHVGLPPDNYQNQIITY